jgi:IS5 family transposase
MRPRTRPLTFADFELQAQGVALDATLQALADFLDAHEALVTLVHQDLVRGLKRPRTGREGLGATEVLRAFVLQRIKAWDLRELRERIADGYTLRRFTTFDACPVPKHDAFHRAFCRLTPATVRALNAAVVQAAVGLGLEDGARRHHRGGDRHPLADRQRAALGRGAGAHPPGQALGRTGPDRAAGVC